MPPADSAAARTVLHVTQTWGTGGTERYVTKLGVFLTSETDWTPELAIVRAPAQTPAAVEGFTAVHAAANVRELFRLLRRTRPSVAHLHLYTALLPAVLTCRAAGVPCVAHLHIPLRDWNARHRLAWRAAVRGANHVCGVARDVLRSVNLRDGDGRATLVPPPITLPEPAPPRPPCDPARPFVIAGVGRLADQKDWPTLLRALPRVRDEATTTGRELRFVHAGGGEREEQFHALIRELGLTGAADARGPVPHAAVAAILDAADLFALPSRFEGLGIAPLEAMARGVPTIVADFPAADDYVTGPPGAETGHTFPRGDSDACAEQILWHLRNPAESAAVGSRGRAFVAERFAPAATFVRVPRIYANLRG